MSLLVVMVFIRARIEAIRVIDETIILLVKARKFSLLSLAIFIVSNINIQKDNNY